MKPEYMTVRLTKEMKESIRMQAERNHRTIAGEVIHLVELGLKADEEKQAILAGKTQIDPQLIRK